MPSERPQLKWIFCQEQNYSFWEAAVHYGFFRVHLKVDAFGSVSFVASFDKDGPEEEHRKISTHGTLIAAKRACQQDWNL